MHKEYDIAIVGASLAGSSAAIQFARAGLKVALIDKATFPRRKPCGEGLSSFGLKQLDLLGIKDAVLQLPTLQYSGYRLKAGSISSILHSPWEPGITIQRSALDTLLLETALSQSNINGFLSHHVTEILPHKVKTRSFELSASAIIVACGGNSSLLRQLKCKETRTGPARAGVTVTYKGAFATPPRFIQIFLKKGFEVYCTPLAEGRLNVSILGDPRREMNLRRILLSKDIEEEVFQELAFEGSIELAPQGRVGIGNVRRSCSVPSVFLIGDALEEFDPIGGMGMSHALHSGIFTAKMLSEAMKNRGKVKFIDNVGLDSSDARSVRAMRRFTRVCTHSLQAAQQWPFLLYCITSPIAKIVLKSMTVDMR